MKYLVFFSLVILFIIGCSSDRNDIGDEIPSCFESWYYSDYFDIDTMIKLETLPSSLISKVDNIIIKNNRILVLNKKNKSVFLFDNYGKFIKKENNVGKGPQQYLDISSIAVTDTTICLLVKQGRQKIIEFDWSLNFISESNIPVRCNDLAFTNKGTYLYYGNNHNPILKDESFYYNLALINNKNEVLMKQLPFDKGYKRQAMYYGSSFQFVKSEKGNTLFTEPFNNSIYFLNQDRIDSVLTINFGYENITDVRCKIKREKLLNYYKKKSMVFSMYCPNQGADFIHFKIYANNYIARCIYFSNYVKKCKFSPEELDPIFGVSVSKIKGVDYDEHRLISIVSSLLLIDSKKKNVQCDKIISELREKVTVTDNPSIILLKRKNAN